jgi:hypothetical protein
VRSSNVEPGEHDVELMPVAAMSLAGVVGGGAIAAVTGSAVDGLGEGRSRPAHAGLSALTVGGALGALGFAGGMLASVHMESAPGVAFAQTGRDMLKFGAKAGIAVGLTAAVGAAAYAAIRHHD